MEEVGLDLILENYVLVEDLLIQLKQAVLSNVETDCALLELRSVMMATQLMVMAVITLVVLKQTIYV